MEMSQYKKLHGTDFDREDELIQTAKGWKEIALMAQAERDQLKAEKELLLTALRKIMGDWRWQCGHCDAFEIAKEAIEKLTLSQ